MQLSPKKWGRCSLIALGLAALAPSAAHAQDLFVTHYGSKTVSRFAATGPGTFSTTATTLSDPSLNLQPSGLAFDAAGDLFIGNYTDLAGSIVEFTAGATPGTFGAATTLTAPSLKGPSGLAFDANGDLFVANSQNNSITEFPAGATPGTFGAATALTAPSLNAPIGLAFDANGDLFATNQQGNSITLFAAGATPGTFIATTTLTGGLNAPQGLAFDAGGNLFVANVSGGPSSGGTITEFPAGAMPGTFGAAKTLSVLGLNGPVAVAFDKAGDLFVANNYNGTIQEYAFNSAAGTFGPAQTIETGLSGAISLAFGPSVPPALVSLAFPSPVPGGTVVTATVTLSSPVSTDTVVGLSSSNSAVVRLFRAVVVPAGSTSATFAINTFRSHATQAVTVSATLGQVVKTVPLTITGR